MAGLLNKLTSGGGPQKSRLHDHLGNRVSISRLFRNGPRALATTLTRLAFDWRPVRPWISYDGQAALEAVLGPRARVLEFGSGMSTVWYARHAGEVISIEDYRPWYDKIGAIIASQGVTNIRYRFVEEQATYATLPSDLKGDGFDLVMIDGSVRGDCAGLAIASLRPGGVIYLDNADMGNGGQAGDVPTARRLLLEAAAKGGWEVRQFTDFPPCAAFVTQGLWVRKTS